MSINLLNTVHNLGILLVFVLLAFLAAEMSHSLPRKRGEKAERWRIMLFVIMLVATVTLIATLADWAN